MAHLDLYISAISSASRSYRLDASSIEELAQANQELLDKMHAYRDNETLIIDLDSTHAGTYRNQEKAAFNAHYGTVDFHPLVTFDGVTGDLSKHFFDLAMSIRPMVW